MRRAQNYRGCGGGGSGFIPKIQHKNEGGRRIIKRRGKKQWKTAERKKFKLMGTVFICAQTVFIFLQF